MIPRMAPGWMRLLLKPFNFGAITLPPWGVFFVKPWDEESNLWKHEAVHWAQYERMGAVRFYATYLWYQLRYGYRNNPMEIEARQ